MQIESISLIIAACVSAALAVASFLRNFRDRLCVIFGVLCVLLFFHDVGAIVESLQSSPPLMSEKLHTLLTLMLGPAFVLLVREILKSRSLEVPAKVRLFLWASPPVIAVVALLMSFDLYPQVSLLLDHFAHIAFCLPAWIGLRTLGRAEKEVRLNRERLRLRFSFWAGIFTAFIFITDALQFSQVLNGPVPALGTLARAIYLSYLFQTFIQKELVTSEEIYTKVAHFGGISLLLSLLYVLLVSWVTNQQGLFYFNTFIASFMIIVLFDPLRALSARLVRRAFLRRHLVLEQELESVSQILMGPVEPEEIAKKLKETIRKCLGTDMTSLFVLEREGFSFVQIEPGQTSTKELSATSPLIEYMALRRGRPFVLESLENDRDFFHSAKPHRFCEQCLDAMRSLNADFIIPFVHAQKPVGFLAVLTGEKVILSNEQLRLFMPVGRQIAQSLKSSEIFNRVSDREKLAALGEMAAGLAHEIKNPLGAIKGAAELLQGENVSANREEFLKIIIDETKRLSGVLSDFLDYAKPRRTSSVISCDPLKVIEHAISLKDPGSRVDFQVQGENTPTFVQVDPEQLKQVLLNLFLNATQALEGVEDPKIRIRIRAIRPKSPFSIVETLPLYKMLEGWRAQMAAHMRAYVLIEVSDNGVGIPREEMERIFVPFYTTKEKGTGLGLAICQRLIEGMGGSIHVKANYPRGTTFTLNLPMVKEETVAAQSRLIEGTT